MLSKTGAAFKKEIEVAVATPQADAGNLVPQALLGAFVGIVPVVIGLLFYPALRGIGRNGLDFVLALTVGLLAFLFIDTLHEAFEMVASAAPAFQGHAMVLLGAAAAFLVLFAVGRRHGTPTGLALATYMALGIGLHNLGEGLAVGAAFAAGAAGLGTFLVLGFTLHNVTEGIGIAAPLVGSRPSLTTFAGLALLGRRPGNRRHLAWKSDLCAALVGARARHRRRRHPPGHRGGRRLPDAQGGQAGGLANSKHGRRARCGRGGDVRNGHAREGVGSPSFHGGTYSRDLLPTLRV